MFEGFSPGTIDFMWSLRLNNEKLWFDAHKDEFIRDFQSPMKELGRAVFECVTAGRGDHGFIHKLSRIYKDARCLHGGEGPYRKKSFSLIHMQPNGEELFSPDLVSRIAGSMLSLMPLYDYLITPDSDPALGK